MDYIKLAWSNFRFIIVNSDLLATKMSLAWASITWAIWAIIVSSPAHASFGSLYSFTRLAEVFPTANIWAWAGLFGLHGVSVLLCLLLRLRDKMIDMATSTLGVILWSCSAFIILISTLNDNTLPFGSAHWIIATMAWWVFIRDILMFIKHKPSI